MKASRRSVLCLWKACLGFLVSFIKKISWVMSLATFRR